MFFAASSNLISPDARPLIFVPSDIHPSPTVPPLIAVSIAGIAFNKSSAISVMPNLEPLNFRPLSLPNAICILSSASAPLFNFPALFPTSIICSIGLLPPDKKFRMFAPASKNADPKLPPENFSSPAETVPITEENSSAFFWSNPAVVIDNKV